MKGMPHYPMVKQKRMEPMPGGRDGVGEGDRKGASMPRGRRHSLPTRGRENRLHSLISFWPQARCQRAAFLKAHHRCQQRSPPVATELRTLLSRGSLRAVCRVGGRGRCSGRRCQGLGHPSPFPHHGQPARLQPQRLVALLQEASTVDLGLSESRPVAPTHAARIG